MAKSKQQKIEKLEKKLAKQAALSTTERQKVIEKRARRKVEKMSLSSKKKRKQKIVELVARLTEKDTAKTAKRKAQLAKLKEGTTGKTDAGKRWNDWEAAEFENDERKAKFLRFMGIQNKTTDTKAATSSPYASAISKEGASRIQKDLEKQFQASIEFRQQTMRGGGRGGLGF